MAGEVLSDRNPAMQMLEEMNSAKWPHDTPSDLALNHDQYLAEAYVPTKTKRRGK
jgi:hypothetical protein